MTGTCSFQKPRHLLTHGQFNPIFGSRRHHPDSVWPIHDANRDSSYRAFNLLVFVVNPRDLSHEIVIGSDEVAHGLIGGNEWEVLEATTLPVTNALENQNREKSCRDKADYCSAPPQPMLQGPHGL
jgi:hypothetical protein